MTKLITMTQKELSRYKVIKRLIKSEINGTEAAKQLNLSVRQIKNIKIRVLKQGAKGVIHKTRGKTGNRKISEKKVQQIERIIKQKYPDFKPTFASEKLEENEQIKINKETLRQLMIKLNGISGNQNQEKRTKSTGHGEKGKNNMARWSNLMVLTIPGLKGEMEMMNYAF